MYDVTIFLEIFFKIDFHFFTFFLSFSFSLFLSPSLSRSKSVALHRISEKSLKQHYIWNGLASAESVEKLNIWTDAH